MVNSEKYQTVERNERKKYQAEPNRKGLLGEENVYGEARMPSKEHYR